jgi:hypothetical protein
MRGFPKRWAGLKFLGAAVILVAGIVVILAVFSRSAEPVAEEPEFRSDSAVSSGAGRVESPAAAEVARERETGSADGFDVVFFAPWGSGEGRLGRREARESDPAGPMAFVVDASGRAAVLDQVNSRVVVFADGKQVSQIALPADTYQDLQLDEAGDLVLMDRLARRSVEVFDSQGRPVSRVALEGGGVPEGGGTTGLFVREDGLWVEVEHTRMVRVADAQGRPDPERPQVGGRFSADGAWLLSAAREGQNQAVVLGRPADAPAQLPRLFSRVSFPLPILHLLALESDTAGRVLLAARLARFEERAPFGVLEERIEAVLLGPDGSEVDRVRLPAPRGALDQFRTLHLSPDGVLYHLYYDENGVSLRRLVL